MDPFFLKQLTAALEAQAALAAEESPLHAALCTGLAVGPSPEVVALFDKYYRIISATVPQVPLMLAGLHHLALQGYAPDLARFYPSCGGQFTPADGPALVAAAEEALATGLEDLLDFMLSQELQPHLVQRSVAVLLGALATVDRFGGGLSLVEIGCSGGLNLRFDSYAYQIGTSRLGDSPLTLQTGLTGDTAAVERLLALGMPKVAARCGLDLDPRDLRDPAERQVFAALLPPDAPEAHAQFQTAAGLLAAAAPLDLRRGAAETDLAPLLVEAYNEMPPGNTLFLFETFLWPYLSDEERRQTALALQRLASQVQPKKPIAWLQVEPFTPGAVELRLHTFGWADLEDRAVRKLAEADRWLKTMNWVE